MTWGGNGGKRRDKISRCVEGYMIKGRWINIQIKKNVGQETQENEIQKSEWKDAKTETER